VVERIGVIIGPARRRGDVFRFDNALVPWPLLARTNHLLATLRRSCAGLLASITS